MNFWTVFLISYAVLGTVLAIFTFAMKKSLPFPKRLGTALVDGFVPIRNLQPLIALIIFLATFWLEKQRYK